MTGNKLSQIALSVGKILLTNGAETSRVEESVERICKACGAKEVHAFAVLTTIIVTITMDDDVPITRTCRIHHRTIELHKVECINNLSRRICYEAMSYDEIIQEIDRVNAFPSYPTKMMFFAYGFVAGLFALFFGGTLLDAMVAFIAGLFIKLSLDVMSKLSVNSFFVSILGGVIAATTALLAVFLFPVNKDSIIIGAIMTLVPGLSITNAIRDLIAGDFLSGVTRGIEAALIGAGIAIGVAVPLTLLKYLGGF
ncbi:MAG: threonine/serine exporter family protein [Eubacteriaceae bacterium]